MACQSYRYPVGEQELLAVIMAWRQWLCYLEGAEGGVTVVTDHKPNTYLDSKPLCNCQAGKVDGRSFCLAPILQKSTARVCIMLLTLSVAILHCMLCNFMLHAAVMKCMLCKQGTLIEMLKLT